MTSLEQILLRNIGNVLTQELVVGIVQNYMASIPDVVCSSVPLRAAPPPGGTAHPRLVADDSERVGEWVAKRVGMPVAWGGFTSLGWLDKPDGELIAGVVITGVTDTNAYIHVAFEGKHALSRPFLHAFFDYVFNQLDLERITATVDADNAAALRFDTHLGFEYEHTIKNGNAGDVIVLVMWRDRCRWIHRENANG